MAFYRASIGGGGGALPIDLENPDKVSTKTLSANASTSITYDQKPRWICVLRTVSSVGYLYVFDCENESGYYWKSASSYASGSITFANVITAISDTGFTYKSNSNTTSYNTFLIYY